MDVHDWRLAIGALIAGVFTAVSIYYYNRLTVLEFEVGRTAANLEASELRRDHVQRSLTALLQHYARYEHDVMSELTRVRMGAPVGAEAGSIDGAEAGEGDSLQDMLGRLQIIAEQYPNLQLTASSQQVANAVISSETEISARIVSYNDAVNVYTTDLAQFPGNLIGAMLGFKTYDFYQVEDRRVLEYKEVDL